MTFPNIVDADTKSGTQSSNSTSWTGTYPTNLASGDLILLFVATDGTASATATGFTGVSQYNDNSSAVRGHVLRRVSDGSETGTFTITMSASEQGNWATFRIDAASWFGDVANGIDKTASTAARGTSANADPPTLNPATWDIEDTLWLAFCMVDGNTSFSGAPSGYTSLIAAASSGAGGAALGIAELESATASQDPGTFTHSSDDWTAGTIAIRPAAAAAPASLLIPRGYRRSRVIR